MEILAIMLAAGLASSVLADVLRLPRMVLLFAAGVLLGPRCSTGSTCPLDPSAFNSC